MRVRSSSPPRSFDDLPPGRRRDLKHILAILLEQFAAWQRTKLSTRKKEGRILKIILFGSQARGKTVADPVSGYFSDYDILVVVNDEELTGPEVWDDAEERISQLNLVHGMRRTTTLIVHALHDINDQLSRGRYFWMDVSREGITLYEARGRHDFVVPTELEPEVAREEARGYFEEYRSDSRDFLAGARFLTSRGSLKIAAFNLHQAAEQAYATLLLTLTLYLPKLHDLVKLHERAVNLDPRFYAIWGEGTKPFGRGGRFGKRAFERLKDAYVKARYSMHYEITEEELMLLFERVGELQMLVDVACRERLGP